MGIASVANACVHLQNAQRARLAFTSLPNIKYNLAFALALHRAGLIASVKRAGTRPPAPDAPPDPPVTSATAATSRLWLGLKYDDAAAPLMARIRAYTTPKRPVTMKLSSLAKVAAGFSVEHVEGLKLGEFLFLATSRGVLEVNEALERKTGGLLLARISPY